MRIKSLLCALLAALSFEARAAEPGVTDKEVVLGQAAAFSGPSAGLGVEMWRGATAAFAEANASGGVNGRTVRLVTADDAYDSEKAAIAVGQLISRDHVFALFGGVGTPTIVKALPVVLKHFNSDGLFYFANFTGAQPQREPPYAKAVFNVRAAYREETKEMVNAFVSVGKKRIGIFVQDDAYGASGRDGVRRALKEKGLDIVADTTYPRGQVFDVSTASQVKLLRDAKVDAIVAVGAYQACAALVRDARSAGWLVPIHNVSFVGADQMLALLLAEEHKRGTRLTQNLINTQVVPSYDDVSVKLVREYRAAMDRYNPTAPKGTGSDPYTPKSKYTFGSLEGYLSARVFLRVLQKAGKDLTRRGFYQAAESMGRFDIGLGVPAELSESRHQALDRVWFTTVGKTGWTPLRDPATALRTQ
jgi:ABC-type branched-subunit amino acid transport system substrate-binding protein